MLVRDSATCPHHRVLDHSLLCELLKPGKVKGTKSLGCSVAHAIVPAGESALPHRLKRSTELYYFLEGTGEMYIGEETAPVSPGQIVLIPPGAAQHIRNTGVRPLVFLCIVAPAWCAEDEMLV